MERQTETKGKEIVLLCLSLFAYLISHHRMKTQQLKRWNERLCWGSIQHSHKQIRQEIPWVWFCWCFLPEWETHSLPFESKRTSSVRTTPLIFLKSVNKAFFNWTPQHWAHSRGLGVLSNFSASCTGTDCFPWLLVLLVYEKSILSWTKWIPQLSIYCRTASSSVTCAVLFTDLQETGTGVNPGGWDPLAQAVEATGSETWILNSQKGGIWVPRATKCNVTQWEFSGLITFSLPYLIARQRTLKV